jgi:hypothetical protein
MKKTVQKISVLCFLALFGTTTINAQNNLEVDASGSWIAYLTCLHTGDEPTTPAVEVANQFFFADNWGIPDVKTVLNAANNTVTLFPNYNLFATGNPEFVQNGVGTKITVASSFKEYVSDVEEEVTYSGYVQSNTLVAGYEVSAFIKLLSNDGNFFLILNEEVPLVAGENFTVTIPVVGANLIVQTGFVVTGLIANPTQEAANGNMVVTAPNLSNQTFENAGVKMYPNPSKDMVIFNSPTLLDNITIFNTVGQQVLEVSPKNMNHSINIAHLQTGMYIVKIQTNGVTATSRLMKN